MKRQKPPNSEVLVPNGEEEEEEEEEEKRKRIKKKKKERRRKDVNSVCSIHYQQFTGSSCYCHRLSTKVDVFLNISSNYVHVPIVVLTDCVHVIILLNSINQLGSVIGTQHVYCKLRTAFLYTQFNFRFPKGQLIRYRDIFGLVSPSVRNHSAIPTKYTQTLHTGTH